MGSKRLDGYHEVRTLLAKLTLSDILTIGPLSASYDKPRKHVFRENNLRFEIKFTQDFPLNCQRTLLRHLRDNLVIRAYSLILTCYPKISSYPISIELIKKIPTGAGMGGGSSDAATTLMALNRFFHLNLNHHRLLELGSRLGSDVAFFLETGTSSLRQKGQFCWVAGRGEQVQGTGYSCRLPALIIYPGFGISTQDAYSWLDSSMSRVEGLTAKDILPKLLSALKHHRGKVLMMPEKSGGGILYNSFENIVFKKYPLLKESIRFLFDRGALGVGLMGSGCAVYALARQARECRQWALAMKRCRPFRNFHYYVTETI